MAFRSKEKQVQFYRDCVESSKRWRKQEGYDALWERMVKLYSGKQFPAALNGEDRIVVNIAFSTINVINPSVAMNNPKLTVWAQHMDDDDRATIVEAVLNYWFRHFEVMPEVKLAVQDFLIVGHGWLKTGYRYVEEAHDRTPDAIQSDYTDAVDQVDQYAQANPEAAADLPTNEDIAASVPDTELAVVEDRPFVERVSFKDVFVDPEAKTPRDMRWIAQRIVRDLGDVKSDERYNVRARNKVGADTVVDDEIRVNRRPRDTDKRVTVWEYYDLKSGSMCVFSEQGDGFLVDPIPQPYKFGHPFTMLRNYEIPDEFYPMGELEAIEDLQGELNKGRSQRMNARKRYARKYLADSRAFNKAAIAALESERDGEVIRVNEGVPLNEAIIPMAQTPVDPQMYATDEQTLSDINLVTGINEYARGALPEIRRTATEASIIQDASNARAADKLARIEGVVGLIGRRMLQLAQQYLTEDQAARIIGNNGQPVWFKFTAEDIQGEFDFEVEGGSTQPQNETFRRQSAMQLLNALGPLAPTGVLNLPELIRYVLQNGFGIKDAAKFLNDPNAGPPPPVGEPPGGHPPQGGPPPVGSPQGSPMQPPQGGQPALAGIPSDGGAPSPVQGIPQQLAQQLVGQMGAGR